MVVFYEPHHLRAENYRGRRVVEAIHILFAGEPILSDSPHSSPALSEATRFDHFTVIDWEALVRMKLIANRDKDRVHLRDLIGVGLIDADWPSRFPAELATRLQHVLDTPDG